MKQKHCGWHRRFGWLLCSVFVCALFFSGCSLMRDWLSKEESSAYTQMDSSSALSSESPDSSLPEDEPESSGSTVSSSSVPPVSEEESSLSEEESGDETSHTQETGLLPPISTDSEAFREKFDQNPIDAAYDGEMAQAATLNEMTSACERYTQFWDSEIDAAYQQLLSLAPGDQYETYRQAQEDWINTREEELSAINSRAQEQGGSMAKLNAATEILQFYRSRAAELYEAVYIYEPDFTFVFQPEA